MIKSLFSLLFLTTILFASHIDYYKLSKIESKAKKLPYLSSTEKQIMKKDILNSYKELNDEEQKYINKKLDIIYEDNKKIEKELKNKKMNEEFRKKSPFFGKIKLPTLSFD